MTDDELPADASRNPVELLIDIERAVPVLSDDDRRLLIARMHGYSCSDIAARDGRPRGTVANQLHVSRQRLRLALDSQKWG